MTSQTLQKIHEEDEQLKKLLKRNIFKKIKKLKLIH